LLFLAGRGLTLESVTRLDIAAYVRDLRSSGVVASDSQRTGTHDPLANATLQQRVTVIRLFYDYLVADNPGVILTSWANHDLHPRPACPKSFRRIS
jgi:site-specific recombinase XerD